MKLAVVVGPRTTATETETLAFALHSLFGAKGPMVEAILPLVDWIDDNRSEWGRIMKDAEATTRFTYNVSWVVGRYLNACILASSAARQGDLGARMPCSFHFIISKLDHGQYAGRQPPTSLQGLLSVRARRRALAAPSTPSPAPPIRYEPAGGNDSQGRRGAMVAPWGRRCEDRSGEANANPRPIQNLRLLPGENTRGMCMEVSLPT